MKPAEAKRLVRRTRRIEGWLEPEAGFLFALLDEAQREQGVTGDVAEIGVHHGKSALLLGAMADHSRERMVVCDLFGGQQGNVSGSGSGDRHVFSANVEAWFSDSSFVKVYEKSSAELSVEEVGRDCRLFHVDGGHSCSEALADLRLAAACLRPGGAIVIDDAFHMAWPGVTEAILIFLRDQDLERFVPLVMGFNKLVLVRSGDEMGYRALLDDGARRNAFIPSPPYELKRMTLADKDVDIFYVPTYRRRSLSLAHLHRLYFRHADRSPHWARRLLARARATAT
jgi:hypothetical protein